MHLLEMYGHKDATYEVTYINHTPRTLCTYLTYITEQVWLPHSIYRPHGQHAKCACGPNIMAYICQNKTKCNFTSHYIAKYVPKTNMATQLAINVIYTKYMINIWGDMYIYVPYFKSMPPTIQQGAMYTYFTCITEQIWMPLSKYTSHGQHVEQGYIPNIFAYTYQHTTKCSFCHTCYCLICTHIWYI